MTVSEAYDFTLEKIEELKQSGIEVIIKPSTNSINNKETVAKYGNRPDRLAPEKWIHVSLKITNEEDQNKIFMMKKYLGLAGISFDTGGWQGYRDWELDWSFTCKNDPNYNAIEATETLEEIIDRELKKDKATNN